MKRIAVVLVMLISIGMTQKKQDGSRMRQDPKTDLTAEEMATLQTKCMTLALEQTEFQQDKVYDIQLENAKFRKEK